MKLNDLKNKHFKKPEKSENCPFEKFANKLDKMKKQLVFEEEYRKIKDREKRYLDRMEQKRKEVTPCLEQKVGE